MTGQVARRPVAEGGARTPVGTVHVVDPHPLMGRSVVETDPTKLGDLGKELDKLVYDEALNVFLCCPQALVAVNKHVETSQATPPPWSSPRRR